MQVVAPHVWPLQKRIGKFQDRPSTPSGKKINRVNQAQIRSDWRTLTRNFKNVDPTWVGKDKRKEEKDYWVTILLNSSLITYLNIL